MSRGERSSLVVSSLPGPLHALVVRARRWLFELDETALSPPRRWGVLALRFLWLVVRELFRDRLQIRAASLSFSTLLAIVPALALAFAAAKAAGVFSALRDDTLMPFLDQALGADTGEDPPGVALLRSAMLGVVALVDHTSITGLGITGTFVLLLAIWRVVRGVDESFAHVFEHRGPRRSAAQRLRAFLVVAIVTPLGLSYAVTGASLSHGGAAAFVASWIPIAWARELLFIVLPPVVVTLTLLVLYLELPDTDVRVRSAFFGAVVAGLSWYGMQLAHVRFQVGLARWNAIYSGFGAFPIFLAVIQLSWVIVLIGAQLVALHMQSASLRVLGSGARRDYETLSALGLEVAIALSRRAEPIALRPFAAELGADLATLRLVLDALEDAGIVSSIETAVAGKRYALAADPTTLRTSDVLDAVARGSEAELPWQDASPAVREALALHRRASDTSEHNVTVATLRERSGRRPTQPDRS